MIAEENEPEPTSGPEGRDDVAESGTDTPPGEPAALVSTSPVGGSRDVVGDSSEPAPPVLVSTGTVIHLARGLGTGRLRAATGRELEFELRFVDTGGRASAEPPQWLREGVVVGYDVAWTSRGLRVCRLFPVRPA